MFPVYPALWSRPEYREPAEELLALCAERDVGVMVIKAVARRPWADRRPLAEAVAGSAATSDRWADSWYEPQASDEELDRGIHFALSTPGVHAFCTPGDIALLPRVLGVGRALRADGRRGAARRRRGHGGRGAHLPHAPLRRDPSGSARLQRLHHRAEGIVVAAVRTAATPRCPDPVRRSGRAAGPGSSSKVPLGTRVSSTSSESTPARSSQRSWRMSSRRRGPTSVPAVELQRRGVGGCGVQEGEEAALALPFGHHRVERGPGDDGRADDGLEPDGLQVPPRGACPLGQGGQAGLAQVAGVRVGRVADEAVRYGSRQLAGPPLHAAEIDRRRHRHRVRARVEVGLHAGDAVVRAGRRRAAHPRRRT